MPGLHKGYPLAGSKSPGLALYCGSFVTADTAAPTTLTGSGWSIAAPSSGTYTITLTDGPFRTVVSGWCVLEDSTGNANDTVRFGDTSTLTSGRTFTIITASAAGTDANLNGPLVMWGLWLSATSVDK